MGQKQTVQDAGGLLTYTYRPDQPTALESETRSGDFQSPPNPNSHTIASLYNEPKTLTYTQDTLNRATGFQIGTPENPTQDYAVTYSYDQANRLDRVSSQGYDFVYQFEPMSTTDRLKSVTADGNKHTQYQYESGRDTITAVINQAGPNNQLISHYAYQYNPDGQRTERTTTTLDAESNILNPPYTDTFQYQEDTGGLNQSTRNGNPRDPNTEYYGYDKIGNRTSLGKGNGEFALYDTNALNQYTSIWNQDGIQAMTHDTDGYQLTKGAQEYTWDAENRLIEVRERGTLRARYTYDHQGRRIARWTSDGADERYLYQDWNLIHIYDANRARPNETYTWGRDLSGSLQGAGGVGGLLMADLKDQPASAWFYHYDANGNVAEITDEDGMLLDWYQYDGFGQLSTMPTQPGNRYRFSTKPQDSETSFYYYGYRYYEPAVGRWLSRDPIGEEGGLNLFGMVSNRPIDNVDVIGMVSFSTVGGPRSDYWDSELYLAFQIHGLGTNVLVARSSFDFQARDCEDGEEYSNSDMNIGSSTLYTRVTSDDPWTFEGGGQGPMSVLMNLYKGTGTGASLISDACGGTWCTEGRVEVYYSYKVFNSLGVAGFNNTIIFNQANPSLWGNEKSHNRWTHNQPAAWNQNPVESGSISAAIAWNCEGDLAAGFSPSVSRGPSRLGRTDGDEITEIMSYEQLDDNYYPGQ